MATIWDADVLIWAASQIVQARDAGLRTFSFPPIEAGSTATFELHVTAIDEGTQAPAVKVLLESGDVIGEDKPSTRAPTPRPRCRE